MSVITVPAYEVVSCDICGTNCNDYKGFATGEMTFTCTDEKGYEGPFKTARLDICYNCLKPRALGLIQREQK